MSDIYNQEVKQKSREKLIVHAIKSLTFDRSNSYLVTKDFLYQITSHFNSLLYRTLEWNKSNQAIKNNYQKLYLSAIDNWSSFYDTICKTKNAEELKVLYLSGPEPCNDIEIFIKNGIRLENIWALEQNKQTYDKAVTSLIDTQNFIKIHRGSLTEFFELVNYEFDIIYLDACSPLLSKNQSPLESLKQIFLNKRLTGLSALITNFAEPGDNLNWNEIFAAWFGHRDALSAPQFDLEFGTAADKTELYKSYCQQINSQIDNYYDKYIPNFISALASEIIPMWQFTSLNSVQSNHLLNEQKLRDMINLIREYDCNIDSAHESILHIQHFLLAIDAYPLLNWTRKIEETFPKNHILYQFIKSTRKKTTVEDALYIGSLLKRIETAESGFKTFIYDICSDRLKQAINDLNFFDRKLGIALDIPMKNLFIELLMGLFSNPYIAHAGKVLSLKYKAKETWMYSDVFIFDQCRYLYEFMPTLDLWKTFFQNTGNQIIIRGCIDGIRRNHLPLNTYMFLWGFIEGRYDKQFGYAELADRINLNNY